MSDVFISYSKVSRSLAEDVASRLTDAGYSVWWDTSLLAGDAFRMAIDKELDASAATLIIWCPDSIKSIWVLSEADHALRTNKLINAHSSDLHLSEIPKPFNQF